MNKTVPILLSFFLLGSGFVFSHDNEIYISPQLIFSKSKKPLIRPSISGHDCSLNITEYKIPSSENGAANRSHQFDDSFNKVPSNKEKIRDKKRILIRHMPTTVALQQGLNRSSISQNYQGTAPRNNNLGMYDKKSFKRISTHTPKLSKGQIWEGISGLPRKGKMNPSIEQIPAEVVSFNSSVGDNVPKLESTSNNNRKYEPKGLPISSSVPHLGRSFEIDSSKNLSKTPILSQYSSINRKIGFGYETPATREANKTCASVQKFDPSK